MRLPRPLNFLLLCLSLLLLQQIVSANVFYSEWDDFSVVERSFVRIALLAGVIHILLLLVQFPRALSWKPRIKKRPSRDVLQERRRMARELHDRVGAQLIGALALTDPADTSHAAQRAMLEHGLLELRLIVDGIDDPDHTLADRLAQLRHRMEPVLHRSGITLEWDVYAASLPDAPRTPLFALVTQEALSNVIQYSKATHVKVSVTRSLSPPSWDLEVVDNGQGMDITDAASVGGSGLRGIDDRMRQAGGEVYLLQPAGGGICLRASLPDVT